MLEDVDMGAILGDLGKLQNELVHAHGLLTDPRERQMVEGMMGDLKRATSEMTPAYEEAKAALEKDQAEARSTAAEAKQKLQARKQKLDEKIAAKKAAAKPPKAPTPPPKPEVKIDPAVGQRLRTELLQRYCPIDPEVLGRTPDDIKEAWQDWS
jgi:hypothetical protein